MKKTIIAIFALSALASCQSLKEEWQPVFTCDSNLPADFVPYTESNLPGFTGTWSTIKELKALYNGKPVEVTGNVWIKGQVISSDKTGNIYRELYIQDETGGIDLKLGKSSLYSEFSLGQWVYVYCDGLTLGAYNGMPQLGLEADKTTTNDYETSYIDVQAIIDQHVFRGEIKDPLKPYVITEDELKAAIKAGFEGELWGKLVTVEGVSYSNEVFALFYPNSNLPHTSANPENRVFLSDKGTWGIDTWACSKNKFIEYLESGVWDSAEVGSGNTRYGSILGKPSDYLQPGKTLDSFGADAYITYKEIMIKYANSNYVSHYFKLGSTTVQVRTSGVARFSDTKLPSKLYNGRANADITGIMTLYNGSAQLSLIDDPSVSVVVY